MDDDYTIKEDPLSMAWLACLVYQIRMPRLFSGQCINSVVVWGGVRGYERCMTSWCMREHSHGETLPLFSVSRMCC